MSKPAGTATATLVLSLLLLLGSTRAFPLRPTVGAVPAETQACARRATSMSMSISEATTTTTRRASVLGQAGTAGLALLSLSGAAGVPLLLSPRAARAAGAAGADAAEVTDRVWFDVAIGGEPVGRLTFALFGKEAPTITGNFLKVLDGKAQGASYDFSSIFRVQKGVCIDMGRVTGGGGKKLQRNINESGYMRISAANAADWTSNTEVNNLRHTEPFLLTMKRGGGTFEFSVTLQPSKDLDKDHVVFGRLDMTDPAAAQENKAVVSKILEVPISTDDPIQSKKLFASAGKGFDPRAKIIYLGKPLKKIQVRNTGRVSS